MEATPQKEAACLGAMPSFGDHNKESTTLPNARLFSNQNQQATGTPQPNTKKRPPTEGGQSSFMSPGSRDMSHRTKHRPAINKNSSGLTASRQASTPYAAPSWNVDGLHLAPSNDLCFPETAGKSSLQISKQLNALLLTPSLSVLQERIDRGIGNDILVHKVADKIVSNLAANKGFNMMRIVPKD